MADFFKRASVETEVALAMLENLSKNTVSAGKSIEAKKKDKKKKKFDKEEEKVFQHYGFGSYFADDSEPSGKTEEDLEYHPSHEGPEEFKREMAEEALLDTILNEDLSEEEIDENSVEDELFEDV